MEKRRRRDENGGRRTTREEIETRTRRQTRLGKTLGSKISPKTTSHRLCSSSSSSSHHTSSSTHSHKFILLPKQTPFQQQSNLIMSYEERSAEFGFVSKDQILETLKNPKAVLLDVRSPAEIQVGGEITGYNSVQSDCTPAMCPTLSTEPEKLVPNKDGECWKEFSS